MLLLVGGRITNRESGYLQRAGKLGIDISSHFGCNWANETDSIRITRDV